MTPIESAMKVPTGDEKAFAECLACGWRKSASGLKQAQRLMNVHEKKTGHTLSVVMAKCL